MHKYRHVCLGHSNWEGKWRCASEVANRENSPIQPNTKIIVHCNVFASWCTVQLDEEHIWSLKQHAN